ncbi:MAG: leucine-rich repeat protein [Tannerella sp.]|nr:leucine-rich repeat protein [Tannerella sp.]
MKRTLLPFIALLFAATAVQAQDFTVGGLFYRVISRTNTVSVYGTNYTTGNITIPATVTSGYETYTVVNVGDGAFQDCRGLTSVTISEGLTGIGDYAFSGCGSMTFVTIPNGIASIGDRAFQNCISLTSFTIPNSVTSIGGGAFAGCTGLRTVEAKMVRPPSISPNTFDRVDLSKVKLIIPGGTASAYQSAGWTGFGTVETDTDTPDHFVIDGNGVLIQYTGPGGDVVIPNGVKSIGSYAFQNNATITSIFIPNSVISIGNSAFWNCISLTSITIPNSVTSIGSGAFQSCVSLTSITIPNSVTSIGEWAFYNCSSLTSVTISNSVTSIGELAFYNCSRLTSVTIPNSVTSIGDYAFWNCISLTSVTIPGSVTEIGDRAFSECSSLTSITVDAGNPSYSSNGGVLFNRDRTALIQYPGGKTGSYTIPGSVTGIGASAFGYCSLTSVTIPGSVTAIGYMAFSDCSSLTSISVDAGNSFYFSDGGVLFNHDKTVLVQCPAGKTGDYTISGSVTGIGNFAFSSCGLTSVTIPGSVTNLGGGAFGNCSSLTDVTVEWAIPPSMSAILDEHGSPVAYDMFYSVPLASATLHVPTGTKALYEAAPGWQDFGIIVESGAVVSVTGVSLNTGSKTLNVNETFQLTATVTPSDATNQTVSWTSSNTGVATVSASGLVAAKSTGTTTITVITWDGNKTATCNVTVIQGTDPDPGPGGNSFAGGTGTATDPYLIATAQQFAGLREYLGRQHSGTYFKLVNNISLSAVITAATGWEPLGTVGSPFAGHLDGAGHKVTGLWTNRTTSDYTGLFGAVAGSIEGLVVETDGAKEGVKGRNYTGALAGSLLAGGSIRYCHAAGSVSGSLYAGGLTGGNSGSIAESYADVDVAAARTGNAVGGLTGSSSGSVTNCYAVGSVSGTGSDFGGLAGSQTAGSITTSYAAGAVTGGGATSGGLVGRKNGSITTCYYLKAGNSQKGAGNSIADDRNVTGLTADRMTSSASFAGFNFSAVWDINEGQDYPFLRNTGVPTSNDERPTTTPLQAYVTDGTLYIRGLTAGERFDVHNIRGQAIHSSRATGGTQTVALPSAGVYIVTTAGQSVKVIYRK